MLLAEPLKQTLPRKEKRSVMTEQPKGTLSLQIRDEYVPVRAIRDFSPGGISVVIDCAIGGSVETTVRYIDQDVDVEVNGTIVWSRPDAAGQGNAHLLGVNLVGAYLLYSFLQNR